jgi:hypothetical protein
MVHQVTLIETDCRGVFEIRCTCGDVAKTYWGEGHAAEIAEMHLWEMAHQGARFLPSGTDPARNLLDPAAQARANRHRHYG